MSHINHHEIVLLKYILTYTMKGVKTVYTITEAEMIQNLCIMKKTLDEVKQKIENITFINNEAFFTFLNELNCPNGETISQILNKLEHCIPFALTDESFELFMSSCNSENIEKMENFRKDFIQSCKNDFILLLYTISDKEQWDNIVQNCEALRKKNRVVLKQKRMEQL